MSETFHDLFRKGESALDKGDTLLALLQFEKAHSIKPLPAVKAKLAFCLARERRQYQKAMALCREALQAEPDNPDHYYQIGRIYLLAGQKRQALKLLRKGLKFRRHQSIIDELNRLGARKEPVFPSLPREHFINRNAGILFTKLGTR